jgi:hypothetical protein
LLLFFYKNNILYKNGDMAKVEIADTGMGDKLILSPICCTQRCNFRFSALQSGTPGQLCLPDTDLERNISIVLVLN